MTRARIIASLAVTVGVALILLFGLGVEAPFAVGWAVLAGIATLCSQLALPDDPRLDAPNIASGPERRGTAIARMAWSLNPSTGMAGALITRRVSETLRRRLGHHGLDPDDPDHRDRINTMIDVSVWDRLSGPETKRQDIERALDAIDKLSLTDKLSQTKEKQ